MMREDPARRRPGHWIPWAFGAFFLVVLIANGTMVYIGMTTWTGLVSENYYEEGRTYNRNIAAAEAQAALGWQLSIEARLLGGFDGELTVELRDRDGRPITDAEVTARFVRPTSEGNDFSLALAPAGQGRYRARFTLPLTGLWDVHVDATRGADRFVRNRRVFLR
ncbi:MAG TPA: hypothetical protein ENJ38_07465 [Rhodospirillales bacterium]|nr:hypothetical protein [Rhodospirillales bacterium]